MFEQLLFVSLFILLIIAVRLLPIMLRSDLLYVDHYYHLLFARILNRNKFRLPKRIDKFLVDKEAVVYPFLYHYFIALFPEKVRQKLVLFLTSLFDSVQFIIIVGVIILFGNQHGFSEITLKLFITIIGILFATYPILMRLGDPRNIAASTRSLGEMFFLIAQVLLYFHIQNGGWLFLAASVFFGSLVFLSSKFATQAFIFFSIFFSIFFLNIVFLIVLIISFFLAIVITGGAYIKVFKGHIAHSNFQRIIQHSSNTSYKVLLKIPRKLLTNPKSAIEDLYKFPLFSIIFHSPLLGLGLFFMVKDYAIIFNNVFYSFFFVWSAISLLICIITSTPLFRFLGEAERYGDYSVSAILIVLPLFVYNEYPEINIWMVFIPFIIWHLVLMVIVLYMWIKAMPSNTFINPLISFLNTKTTSSIACIPVNLSYQIAYQTNHKVLFNIALSESIAKYKTDLNEFNSLYYKYPLLSLDLQSLITKYKLNFFIIKKTYAYMSLSSSINLNELYDFSKFKNIYENQEYILYQVNPSTIN